MRDDIRNKYLKDLLKRLKPYRIENSEIFDLFFEITQEVK